MQSATAAPTKANTREVPKNNNRVTLRIDDEGFDLLASRAKAEFLDPATYARQVLMRHLSTREATA